jgi:ABC-type multidrug transport system ATPase subunit
MDTPGSSGTTSSFSKDPEAANHLARHLTNDSVQAFSWRDVSVRVKDRKSKQPLTILSSSYCYVDAGQVLAIMGPSGSGKTTLLNVLAQRMKATKAEIQGKVMVNGQELSQTTLGSLSSYVEQEDALIGSLTVRETVDFAARLALPSRVSSKERKTRVDDLIDAFGLRRQAGTIVGTPLQKGISGGQKRRLSVASQLVTSPKILFLDEPTSGLDSAASHEVMSYISTVAKQHQIIVIASIHQPSSATFATFDRVLMLSEGKTCFYGNSTEVSPYFERIGHTIPIRVSPAEFVLDILNTDFAKDSEQVQQRLASIHEFWSSSPEKTCLLDRIAQQENSEKSDSSTSLTTTTPRQTPLAPLILLHRNFIKSHRDLLAYGTRVAMYFGLAIMMGTVWLRLPYHQSSIQPWTNAIFFGGAFMSFMAVAYIPPAIEDLLTFRKERHNGLYGPASFVFANFLIGIPYLFLISLLFSIVVYWLANLRSSAEGFWMWVLWLFLDLLAAEGLVMLVTALAPIFVVALAVTAFANGLWMCVSGFLVPMGSLNVFWKCKSTLPNADENADNVQMSSTTSTTKPTSSKA